MPNQPASTFGLRLQVRVPNVSAGSRLHAGVRDFKSAILTRRFNTTVVLLQPSKLS